jgi:predicted TIM-barrel fold metal-dependent hydrolase
MQTLPPNESARPRIDFHLHVGGLGIGDTGCFIAERRLRSPTFRYLKWMFGMSWDEVFAKLDERCREILIEAIQSSRHIDAGLVYAHDRIYDRDGRWCEELTEVYTPNDYVLRLARQYPFVLPAVSIHPYRRDAIEELDRCIEADARAVKWLPNSQGMDPADERLAPFYDVLAARRIPLICHTGGEHTVRVRWSELGDPMRLRLALERGVTVVAAHCGSKSGLLDHDWFGDFVALTRRHPNLYGDTGGMCIPFRCRFLVKILREEGLMDRIVHGSDFPIPPLAWSLARHIGWRTSRRIDAEPNWIERDYLIKEALGFPPEVFTRGASLLRVTADSIAISPASPEPMAQGA